MNIQPCTMYYNFCQSDKSNLLFFSNWAYLNIIKENVAEYYLYQIFSGPRATWYPTFHNSNANTGFARYFGIAYYFSTLQFNQSGSVLTDPQKFALTPGF